MTNEYNQEIPEYLQRAFSEEELTENDEVVDTTDEAIEDVVDDVDNSVEAEKVQSMFSYLLRDELTRRLYAEVDESDEVDVDAVADEVSEGVMNHMVAEAADEIYPQVREEVMDKLTKQQAMIYDNKGWDNDENPYEDDYEYHTEAGDYMDHLEDLGYGSDELPYTPESLMYNDIVDEVVDEAEMKAHSYLDGYNSTRHHNAAAAIGSLTGLGLAAGAGYYGYQKGRRIGDYDAEAAQGKATGSDPRSRGGKKFLKGAGLAATGTIVPYAIGRSIGKSEGRRLAEERLRKHSNDTSYFEQNQQGLASSIGKTIARHPSKSLVGAGVAAGLAATGAGIYNRASVGKREGINKARAEALGVDPTKRSKGAKAQEFLIHGPAGTMFRQIARDKAYKKEKAKLANRKQSDNEAYFDQGQFAGKADIFKKGINAIGRGIKAVGRGTGNVTGVRPLTKGIKSLNKFDKYFRHGLGDTEAAQNFLMHGAKNVSKGLNRATLTGLGATAAGFYGKKAYDKHKAKKAAKNQSDFNTVMQSAMEEAYEMGRQHAAENARALVPLAKDTANIGAQAGKSASKLGKFGKAGLAAGAVAGLAYGGKKLYDKFSNKNKQQSFDDAYFDQHAYSGIYNDPDMYYSQEVYSDYDDIYYDQNVYSNYDESEDAYYGQEMYSDLDEADYEMVMQAAMEDAYEMGMQSALEDAEYEQAQYGYVDKGLKGLGVAALGYGAAKGTEYADRKGMFSDQEDGESLEDSVAKIVDPGNQELNTMADEARDLEDGVDELM